MSVNSLTCGCNVNFDGERCSSHSRSTHTDYKDAAISVYLRNFDNAHCQFIRVIGALKDSWRGRLDDGDLSEILLEVDALTRKDNR